MMRILLPGLAPFAILWAGGFVRMDDERAVEMLIKSMQGDFGANVSATIYQRDHRGSNLYERIKILRSRHGQQHWTVVEPLSHAGIESVDDGSRWQTYIPDERLLIDQASPGRARADLRRRLRLARQNYVFMTKPHVDIAGRPVYCVCAAPRNNRLDERRYCLDARTAYPLRMETLAPSGAVTVVYDTKDVQFPDAFSPGAFEMHPLPGFNKLTYDRPRSMSKREVKNLLGFDPIEPGELPLGFHLEDMQYSGSQEWKSVVVRLTDGLARANVYEWWPDNKPKKAMADSTAGECHGIKFLLVSDNLSPDLRRELLAAFLDNP